MVPGDPGPDEPAEDVIARFCRERWTNPTTIARNQYMLRRLVADCQVERLAELTPTAVLRWCAGADSPVRLANNTIRGRAAVVTALLRWCGTSGVVAPAPEHLTDRNSPIRQFRPTYGKAQAPYPPRWLTYFEAFVMLVGAVDSSTPIGLRDEIVLRLGPSGVRAQEIVGLVVGDIRDLKGPHPSLHWMGKGYRPLHVAIGPQLVVALRRYLRAYADALGGPLQTTAPLICRSRNGRNPKNGPRQLDYGNGLKRGPSGRASVWNIVTAASQRAMLGHVGPHDLLPPPPASCTATSGQTGPTGSTSSTSRRCCTTPIR